MTATHRAPAPAPTRVPSAHAQPSGGAATVLRAQLRTEIRQNVRVPEYIAGVIAVPVLLYAMFGLPQASVQLSSGTRVGFVLFASIACYGVVSLAIFTFGVDTAAERDKGWLRRLRATPMPMWAYFAAKVAVAVIFTAAILAFMLVVAVTLGRLPLDPARTARVCGVLLAGTVAFSTAGFALAYGVRPKAASAIGNLIFLPLSFLSGFFVPLSQLPEVFRGIAPWLPTYHFGQLVWSQAVADDAELVDFGSPAPGPWWWHAGVVLASFLLFAALAAWAYRRDATRSRT